MKMKIAYNDFQIHTVPMEKIVFDEIENQYYILLDDINCIRWKVSFEAEISLMIVLYVEVCMNVSKVLLWKF